MKVHSLILIALLLGGLTICGNALAASKHTHLGLTLFGVHVLAPLCLYAYCFIQSENEKRPKIPPLIALTLMIQAPVIIMAILYGAGSDLFRTEMPQMDPYIIRIAIGIAMMDVAAFGAAFRYGTMKPD